MKFLPTFLILLGGSIFMLAGRLWFQKLFPRNFNAFLKRIEIPCGIILLIFGLVSLTLGSGAYRAVIKLSLIKGLLLICTDILISIIGFVLAYPLLLDQLLHADKGIKEQAEKVFVTFNSLRTTLGAIGLVLSIVLLLYVFGLW